jgi:Ca2+-binding RTX toxin-like protein
VPSSAAPTPRNDPLNGGFLNDNLSDSAGQDTLRGNDGNDALFTDFGPNDGLSDVLEGGDGADDLRVVTTNSLFGVPQPDGAIDTLDGGPDTDTCRVPATEGDVRVSCETVETD